MFRPLFTNDEGTLFITGYEEETGTNVLTVPMRDPSCASDRAALQSTDMVCGVPVIVGARTGFPSLFKCALESRVDLQRRLQIVRAQPSGPIIQTNQLHGIAISNFFGVSAWHPFTNIYPRPLTIKTRLTLRTLLRGSGVIVFSNQVSTVSATNFDANQWRGHAPPSTSFVLPLDVGTNCLPFASYIMPSNAPPYLTNLDEFPRDTGFSIPNWFLESMLQLNFTIVDTLAGRVVDYVNLNSPGSWDICSFLQSYLYGSPWNTNGGTAAPTIGIMSQIQASLGYLYPYGSQYYKVPPYYADDVEAFRNFFYGEDTGTCVREAPLTAASTVYVVKELEANDPILHHTEWQLAKGFTAPVSASANPPHFTLKTISAYRPWGGGPEHETPSAHDFNAAIKDPLVWIPDNWDFPSGESLNVTWLGRIHRGTPWQTIYLKSAGINQHYWNSWIGPANLSKPTNDWRLASLFAQLVNTNPPRNLLSINENCAEAWLSALSGNSVLTNIVADGTISDWLAVRFSSITIASNSPEALVLANAITGRPQSQRPLRNLGAFLSIPELSWNSPWLNRSEAQRRYGISDQAYEAIPAQLLGLIRPDSEGSIAQGEKQFTIQFSGLEGCTYEIQTSSNLLDWTPTGVSLPAAGKIDFADTNSTSSAPRFYRSMLLP